MSNTTKMSGALRALYVLVPLALVAFIGYVFYQQMARAPSREMIVGSGDNELRVQLWTSPDPPKTGAVPVEVRLATRAGTLVQVDKTLISYGQAGKEAAATVEAERQPDGAYRASATFTSVGDWWIEVTVLYGPLKMVARFPVYVAPNI